MRILIIRHADPDYTIDSLTPTGWEEARLLSERLTRMKIDYFYVSPLGRAQDTASCTLDKLDAKAVTLDWLREFDPVIDRPDRPASRCTWDWLPADWTKESRYFDRNHWFETEIMQKGHVGEAYRQVTESLDELLARHGYVREKDYYRAAQPNRDVIALFCHFGLECVLLSHLLNISPMPLWHGACAPPSSVTSIVTEERREGIAYFRMGAFGDTSHLYAGGREPSFAARFCETYSDPDERHD
ncbi:MAG: histidine phosphatase family protein [Clostridiales bacterium]|nr:histidine phosphatase family protein [Clostridiales bacterium]